MASGSNYKVAFRRRREGKTDDKKSDEPVEGEVVEEKENKKK